MKKLPLVDLAATYAELRDELEAAVLRVCRSQRYVGGQEVAGFEERFASYLSVRHVVGMGNGTDALELALRALGIGHGDEVLVPANTFVATAEAVCAVGAVPRFVDVDPASGLIDLESCAQRVVPATRAVVPVHLYGRMVDMSAVMSFALRHGLLVVEDAAQAHGARRDGQRAGTLGHIGCFSFYPGKNLGAMGDAGTAVTNDDTLADTLRLLRDHGRRTRDLHDAPGHNSRLDPVQAAVLSVKLVHLDRWNAARRDVAEAFRRQLSDEVLDWRADGPEEEVHHLFPILVDERDALAASLAEAEIATGVHYRYALPTTKAFAASTDYCPVAEQRARRQLSLPIHPHLDEEDVLRIAEGVNEFVVGGMGTRRQVRAGRRTAALSVRPR